MTLLNRYEEMRERESAAYETADYDQMHMVRGEIRELFKSANPSAGVLMYEVNPGRSFACRIIEQDGCFYAMVDIRLWQVHPTIDGRYKVV